MLQNLHAAILNIHDTVGEETAEKWIETRDSQKEKVQAAQQVDSICVPFLSWFPLIWAIWFKVNTPAKKKPRKAKAAASSETEAALANLKEEVEDLKDNTKTSYLHLIEMDEQVREKLFILQVPIESHEPSRQSH